MAADRWRNLVPGTAITVVKLAPDGRETARYPGEIVATWNPGSWVVVRATWTYATLEVDGLSFCPGDDLLEWFSPELPFNAFAVFSPTGELRGWYANVTKPAYLFPAEAGNGRPMLVWHDLYVDLVGLPGGEYTIRDLDELCASPLASDDPKLFECVLEAGNELQRRFANRLPPFVATSQLAIKLDVSMNSPSGG
jgi:uncharacterized protein